jgi:hypothetical protein
MRITFDQENPYLKIARERVFTLQEFWNGEACGLWQFGIRPRVRVKATTKLVTHAETTHNTTG